MRTGGVGSCVFGGGTQVGLGFKHTCARARAEAKIFFERHDVDDTSSLPSFFRCLRFCSAACAHSSEQCASFWAMNHVTQTSSHSAHRRGPGAASGSGGSGRYGPSTAPASSPSRPGSDPLPSSAVQHSASSWKLSECLRNNSFTHLNSIHSTEFSIFPVSKKRCPKIGFPIRQANQLIRT